MKKQLNNHWKTIKHNHMQLEVADGVVWADVMHSEMQWEWRAWAGTHTLEHGSADTLGAAQVLAEAALWAFYEAQHDWWIQKEKGESDKRLEEMLT